jgi:hypothetical protein
VGASGWHHLVPYKKELSRALAELRQEVYDNGDFYREEPDPAYEMTEEEFVEQLDPRDAELGINEFLVAQWREAHHRPPVSDPDTLLASQPHSGTHSVIDLARGISAEPAAFTASPLTSEQMLEAFGTVSPYHQQLLTWAQRSGYRRYRARWEGVYVLSYGPDGNPDMILFAGYSGD